MSRYYLLIVLFVTLLITGVFARQSQGGLRFFGNTKRIVKVIPWAINVVLFCLVLLLYVSYAILYMRPIGIAIGIFLESTVVYAFGTIWFLVVGLYIGVVQFL